MVVLSIFSGIFFYVNNTSFFFHWHLFFYFISNNSCRLLIINIVSFIFFYYRESKPPFSLHYEKSSPLNIVYRKINWQNPASISAYTQSEYRISNYVNHIRIINHYTTDTVTFLLSVVSSITCTHKYSMSYTFKENENAVWCLGNVILASLGSSKCSHFYYL
jgi:hypothetical protein